LNKEEAEEKVIEEQEVQVEAKEEKQAPKQKK